MPICRQVDCELVASLRRRWSKGSWLSAAHRSGDWLALRTFSAPVSRTFPNTVYGLACPSWAATPGHERCLEVSAAASARGKVEWPADGMGSLVKLSQRGRRCHHNTAAGRFVHFIYRDCSPPSESDPLLMMDVGHNLASERLHPVTAAWLHMPGQFPTGIVMRPKGRLTWNHAGFSLKARMSWA